LYFTAKINVFAKISSKPVGFNTFTNQKPIQGNATCRSEFAREKPIGAAAYIVLRVIVDDPCEQARSPDRHQPW